MPSCKTAIVKKCSLSRLSIAVSFLVLGCMAGSCANFSQKNNALNSKNTSVKFFNKDEFVGLELIKDQGEVFELDYQLDKREGGLRTFLNCDDVMLTSEKDIVPSQLIYLKTLQVNCLAASHYKAAPVTSKKQWPAELSEAFILDIPAVALPELVSLNPVSRLGKVGDLEVFVEQQGPLVSRLVVDELDIHIIQLARGDFTNDGLEDLILRLDWSVIGAFGRGVDWVLLSRNQEMGNIVVERSSRTNNN